MVLHADDFDSSKPLILYVYLSSRVLPLEVSEGLDSSWCNPKLCQRKQVGREIANSFYLWSCSESAKCTPGECTVAFDRIRSKTRFLPEVWPTAFERLDWFAHMTDWQWLPSLWNHRLSRWPSSNVELHSTLDQVGLHRYLTMMPCLLASLAKQRHIFWISDTETEWHILHSFR